MHKIETRMLAIAVAMTALAVGAFDGLGAQSNTKPTLASKEWPTYGHDPGGMRFSPLTQITPANVGQLKVAWVYHMRPRAAPAAEPRAQARHRQCDAPPPQPAAAADAAARASARARSRRSSSTA